MANQPIHSPKDYSESLTQITIEDPVHADTVNPIYERLINNDAYLNQNLSTLQTNDNSRQVENIGDGVYNGLNVLDSSTPDMNVHVQTGVIFMPNGQRYEFSTVNTIAVKTADATYARKDIIYVDSTGVVQYTAGTASSSPSEPSLPSDAHKLCVIDVPAGDTAIEQTQITDSRTMLQNLGEVDNKIGVLSNLATTDKTDTVSAINEVDGDLSTHTSDTTNPHSVTASQVGSYSKSEVEAINSELETLYWMGGI